MTALTRNLAVGGIGLFLSMFMLLVVFTFPGFFLFNPLDEPNPLRQVQLIFSTFAWVTQAIIPGAMLVGYAFGRTSWIRVLPFAALVWPLGIIMNQVTLYVLDGIWYTGYLIQYPVFIGTDIIMPIFIIFLWQVLRKRALVHDGISVIEPPPLPRS